ncbi:LOW QUALITY PROTEIN: Gag-Pol polyprotein [Plecturocebus cupreus]
MPDCPLPLLGRDLLSMLRATITFTDSGTLQLALPKTGIIMALRVPHEEEWRLFLTKPDQEIEPALAKQWPKVWAEDPPGLTINQASILIEVKPGVQPAKAISSSPGGPRRHSGPPKTLKDYGIIVPCQSPWNIPLLPIPKPGTKDYRPVQDYIRLASESQKLFAFQWENPETGVTTQYTWTWLSQGFKNSPTVFGEVLACDLQKFPAKDLGCIGERSLGAERKQVICNLPGPKTRRQVREFLGAVDFCRLWIPNFTVLAKPLYEVTKRGDKEPYEWGSQQRQTFQELKEKLISALALGLPDLTKPFMLYVSETEKNSSWSSNTNSGTLAQACTHLSKQLDGVSTDGPQV